MSIRIAVIHCSATGNVHALASAIADGAASEGAEVRLRKVATGNPYGSSWVSKKGSPPDDDALATARHQGRRLARVATALRALR